MLIIVRQLPVQRLWRAGQVTTLQINKIWYALKQLHTYCFSLSSFVAMILKTNGIGFSHESETSQFDDCVRDAYAVVLLNLIE